MLTKGLQIFFVIAEIAASKSALPYKVDFYEKQIIVSLTRQ